MVESIDDITQQARQGSVAAIIQILNDRLSDHGVRTRAVLAQGILQLLCEAEKPDYLKQDALVSRIQKILESLRPRHIRRVRINSRLVREQQLLWLEEIQNDPDGQLLWSQEIRLPSGNPIQFLAEDLAFRVKAHRDRIPTPSAKFRQQRDRQQFWRGIIGGAGLSLLVVLLGWLIFNWLDQRSDRSITETTSNVPTQLDNTDSTQTPQRESDTNSLTPTQPVSDAASASRTSAESEIGADPFAQAVIIAEQAVADGQTATTPAEWLDLASRWQRASDLMAEVSPDDSRYATARDRQKMYQENSEQALSKANLLRMESQSEPSSNTPPVPQSE